ncbi:glycosyltransferase family 2 protein [Rhizobium sp.]
MQADQLRAELTGLAEGLDHQKTLSLRHQLLGADPNDLDNICEYARLLLSGGDTGDRDRALGLLDGLIASKAYLPAFLRKADFLAARQNHDEAFSVLEAASRAHPTNYWPNIKRARLNAQIGNFETGKAEIRRCTDRREDQWTNLDLFDAYIDIAERQALAQRDRFDISRSDGPAIAHAAALILAKDEEDIIGHNLAHHYRQGLRTFVIIDNGSTDGTLDRIKIFQERYSECLVHVILDPVVAHYQAAKTNAGFAFIRAYLGGVGHQVKWLIPIDSDEFICSTSAISLAALLDKAERDHRHILTFNSHNAGSSHADRDIGPEEDVFAHFDLRKSPPRENVFKVAVNCEAIPDARFEEGNHRIVGGFRHFDALHPATADGFLMFHLPIRSVRHIRSKVIKGGLALRAAHDLRNAGGHWRRWYEQYEAQGEALFPRMVDGYLRSLR